jgi:DNA-binding MarR family transcriptional regulator
MEIFLMAAVSRGGLNTLYALKQEAGLEPGSIKKAIEDLVEAGLLHRSEGAKRGRRAMAVTDAGERLLVAEWKDSLDPRREVESVLRGVTVALLMDDIGEAIRFLGESALERERRQGPHGLGTVPRESTPVDLHSAMREIYESRRRKMEAEVLSEFAINLMEVAKNRKGK